MAGLVGTLEEVEPSACSATGAHSRSLLSLPAEVEIELDPIPGLLGGIERAPQARAVDAGDSFHLTLLHSELEARRLAISW